MGCTSSTIVAPGQRSSTLGAAKVEAPQDDSFFAKYHLGVKLGKGGFAQVREASCKSDDSIWAVKVLDLRAEGHDSTRVLCEDMKADAVEEAGAWRAAGRHANIVHLQDAYLEHDLCFFVMELCDQSFYQFLESGAGCEELNESALSSVFSQVLQGCEHLHGLGVVHRDLKPDNLISRSGVVKICDFGLAACLPSGRGLSGIFGTAPYMAPEMLNAQPYDALVDVWSLGVIAYVLFYGAFPYAPERRTPSEMKRAIREGKRPSFAPSRLSGSQLPTVSGAAKSFAESMLNRDPKERAAAAALLQEPYLQDTRFVASRPPLAASLACAALAGAFENRIVEALDWGLDPLLSELHLRYTGARLAHFGAPRKSSEAPSVSTAAPDASCTPSTLSLASGPGKWSLGQGDDARALSDADFESV